MSGKLRSTVGAAIAIAAVLMTVAPHASADSLARVVAGADAPRTQLQRTSSTAAPGGGVIERFQQEVGGLPVFGAEVVAVDGPRTPPMLVSDYSVDGVEPANAGDAISRASAITAARDAVGAGELRVPATVELGVLPGSGKLAWEVTLTTADGAWAVMVDAVGGDKLRVDDLVADATGTASLYSPNPVVQQGSYKGLKDKKDKDYSRLTQLRIAVTLERLTSTKGCLKGTYVDVRSGVQRKKVCEPGANFTGLTRSDEEFEAVMAYFHIDRTRAYVDSLGLSQPLRAKPQKVFSNVLTEDNSRYFDTTHDIELGTGGVDDGEDADVIVHEYGHSLTDQAAENTLRKPEGDSIGEAFGDYMAAVMSNLTTGGSPFDTCIFDWDGIVWGPDGKCGRYADLTATVSKLKQACGPIEQAYHCIGQAWSSALIELRTLLGADVNGQPIMDRVVLEANFLNTKKTDFRDAARGLLAADQLLYGGAHAAQIQAEMTERKFCPAAC